MKTIVLRTFVILILVISGMTPSIAAMDDVIVWNSARTQAQIEDTLVNGYTSTTGMTMWWKFNNADNLVYDEVSAGTNGVIKGSPSTLPTLTPNDTANLAASGFTSKDNWLVADIPQSCYEAQTYEMWIRNPQLNGSAVFWSISGSEDGGDYWDSKRLAVNADGSLTMMDRGYYTGYPWYTSPPLVWEPNKWYQITVVMEYKGGSNYLIGVKVYRGAKGDTSVTKIFDYDSSVPVGQDYWMSIGAHPDGIPGVFPGGYLGGEPEFVLNDRVWWDGSTETTSTVLGNLLSDNRFYYGPSVLTGVTYTYQGTQPANPADEAPWPGKRLLDGRVTGDWTVPIGLFGYDPLVVIFDFKRPCTFSEVDFSPISPQWTNGRALPTIIVETSNDASNWDQVYTGSSAAAKLVRIRPSIIASGRYMRLTLDDGDVYEVPLSEVWVWGSATVNSTYPEAIDPVYSAQGAGYFSIPGIDSTEFTSGQFNAWKTTLGSYASQPAVWSQTSTWGTISSAPILPAAPVVLNGNTVTINMARNMTEQRAFALTNTSLAETTMNMALGDMLQNGQIAPNISGSLRVMAAMPTSITSNEARLFSFFSADNMLYSGLMERYLTNGAYITDFPSVTLTPGGSSVFWVSINTKNCAAGTYTTTLSASGGSPVTIQVNVYDITLPSPSPTWVNTWEQSTREQVPFVFSDWTEKQVDYATSLGTSVWNGWPTPGSAAALARAKNPAVIFRIQIPLSDDPLVLAATVNALVAQAQALGLTYEQWYVELWDEPNIGNAAAFGVYCQVIKNTNPNVHIYIDPCVWDASDQQTYDAFSPWYNNLIDISVPDTYSTNRTLSFSLWNAPRFVKAHYYHETDGISEADAEVVRKLAWKSFDLGWNGWGCWSLYGPWPYAPYDDPWTVLDEAGNTTVLDHMMAYPGPNGPVGTRRSEGVRAGWEDYCLLTLMRQRGMTSSLNTILANYNTGTALQTLREQALLYLSDTVVPVAGTSTPPASVTTTTISVPYSGASDATSGLNKVELWYKKESGGNWTNSGLIKTAGSDTFTFTPSSGSGRYYFDLVAEDNAGNRSAAASGNGDGVTIFKLRWSDGFESNNFTTGGWTNSGCTISSTYKYSGTYAAEFNSTDSLTKSYSTSGKTNIIVEYARYLRTVPSSGHFIADWSTNGTSWTTLEDRTGVTSEAWSVKTWSLPTGANGKSGFRIRFRVTGYSSSQYAYLDDVKIIGL